MKIAIVIESFDPEAGGNERSTAQIARRLIALGHAVTVLTSRAPAGDLLPGGRVVARGGRGTGRALGLLGFARWAGRQLDRGGFHVSLSVTLAVPATVVQPRSGTVRETLARNIARRPTLWRKALKVVGIGLTPKQLMLLYLEWRTLRHPRVKRVVAISRFAADQLFHHYTIPLRRTVEIPNAAEIERFDDADRRGLSRQVRRTWRIDDDHVAFLFAAMNPGLKGLAELFDAMAKLRDAGSPARLLIAGTLASSFVFKAERMRLNEVIRWIGPTRRIDALYAAADVTVLPTFYDPSSKVVIESLRHGVPAISTRFNGASQWIADPTRGAVNTSPYAPASAHEGADLPQPAGRVISSPSAIDELVAAMTDLCDADQRRRCAEACATLDPRLRMSRHVEALMGLLEQVAAAQE